jgi:hypothetical protein
VTAISELSIERLKDASHRGHQRLRALVAAGLADMRIATDDAASDRILGRNLEEESRLRDVLRKIDAEIAKRGSGA